jgi:hypothetical protein
MMHRTLYPDRRGSVRVWHLYVPGEALYRLCTDGAQWRLKERSIYGGPWQRVADLDVSTWLTLHHCTLAGV